VLFLQHIAQLFLRVFIVISFTAKYSWWRHRFFHGKLPVLLLRSVGWKSICAVLTVCHIEEYPCSSYKCTVSCGVCKLLLVFLQSAVKQNICIVGHVSY